MGYYFKFNYGEAVFKYKIQGHLNMNKIPMFTMFSIKGIGTLMLMDVEVDNETILDCSFVSVDGRFRSKWKLESKKRPYGRMITNG